MTTEERMRFLNHVKTLVEEDPSLFADIVTVSNSGIEERITSERNRAADMETIAVAMYSLTNGKYKEKNQNWITSLIQSKITKWSESSYLGGWEKVLEELKNKY
jgi:hypothetical protein